MKSEIVTETVTVIAGFHAHVYFDRDSRDSAIALQGAFTKFAPVGVRVYPPIDRPIGPHPTPMFEIDFNHAHFHAVVTWLMLNHGEHSVLVHPITGDDMKDHFEFPIWIGKVQTLDSSAL